jgi:hypothetical protein
MERRALARPTRAAAAVGLALVAAASATACSPSHESGDAGDGVHCAVGFLGDAAAAPEFDFLALQVEGGVAPLEDGGTLPILVPPQGDRYVFPGVRATNVDGCQLEIIALVRNLATHRVATERRYITLVPTGDGWGVSGVTGESIAQSAANFANVEVCPNTWSSTDVPGHVYGLEVTIQDRENRQLTKKILATPRCAEPDTLADCLCVCHAGYVLGQACDDGGVSEPDGGVADGQGSADAGGEP